MPPKKTKKLKCLASLWCVHTAPLSLQTPFLHFGVPDHTALPRRELGAGGWGQGCRGQAGWLEEVGSRRREPVRLEAVWRRQVPGS